MLGGLHIEMAALRMLGHLMAGSGWVECLTMANVTTAGVAESFLHASHVKRTRYAHTVTAAALNIPVVLKRTYASYCEQSLSEVSVPVSYNSWCTQRQNESVQFKF